MTREPYPNCGALRYPELPQSASILHFDLRVRGHCIISVVETLCPDLLLMSFGVLMRLVNKIWLCNRGRLCRCLRDARLNLCEFCKCSANSEFSGGKGPSKSGSALMLFQLGLLEGHHLCRERLRHARLAGSLMFHTL